MLSAYNTEQLQQFLNYIELPEQHRYRPPSPDLLRALHIHTLSKLPYENLSLHYNPTSQAINLDPQFLFQKMVVDDLGRGGFCMEIAILYNHILRAIGFNAYTAGVRTRPRIQGIPQGDFPGWGHIVNIVEFADGSKYHADVAFGGDGATAPLPLVDGTIHQNLGTQQVRLIREWLPTQVHRSESSKLWIYQYRNNEEQAWNSFYAFGEVEFMLPDWGVVNHWMCTHPDSNQVRNVLVVKFLRRGKQYGSSDEQEIYGKRMLVNDTIKQNLGGKTVVMEVSKTERQRTDALHSHFGMVLSESEKMGIRGSPLQLAERYEECPETA